MSADRADLRQIRARLSVQERSSQAVSVRVEEVAEQVAEIAINMATKDDIKKILESMTEQFKHVYGMLADQQANIQETRNMLATLIERREKP